MVLNPDEAYALRDVDSAQIQRIEEAVDEAIRAMVRGGRNIWISTELFGRDKLIRDAVVADYEAAGWNVIRHDDQRDGSAYEFRRQ